MAVAMVVVMVGVSVVSVVMMMAVCIKVEGCVGRELMLLLLLLLPACGVLEVILALIELLG